MYYRLHVAARRLELKEMIRSNNIIQLIESNFKSTSYLYSDNLIASKLQVGIYSAFAKAEKQIKTIREKTLVITRSKVIVHHFYASNRKISDIS